MACPTTTTTTTRSQARVVLYIEVVLFTLLTLAGLLSCFALPPTAMVEQMLDDSSSSNPQINSEELGRLTLLAASFIVALLLLHFIVLLALWRGAGQRSTPLLMLWIVSNSVQVSLVILTLLYFLLSRSPSPLLLLPAGFISYRIWSLHVVHSLYNEYRFMALAREGVYGVGVERQIDYACSSGAPHPVY